MLLAIHARNECSTTEAHAMKDRTTGLSGIQCRLLEEPPPAGASSGSHEAAHAVALDVGPARTHGTNRRPAPYPSQVSIIALTRA